MFVCLFIVLMFISLKQWFDCSFIHVY